MNYSLGQSSDNYAGSEDALGNIYLVYSIDDSIKLVKYNQNGKILFEIPLDRYTLGLKVMDNGEIVTTYKTVTGLKLSIINQKGKTINNKDIIGVQETKNQTNIYTKKDKTIEQVIIPGKFRVI